MGSARRECLNHAIVLSEAHLKRILHGYIAYYNHSSHYPFVPSGGAAGPFQLPREAGLGHWSGRMCRFRSFGRGGRG